MSPFCNKTRRCLAVKAIAYDVVDYNGLEARKAATLTPAGQLPVLDWDGERVQDSARIAEFLDRMRPDPALYPADRQLLARARFWEDWAGQSLYFYEIYFRMLDPISMERSLDLICKGRPTWERGVMRMVFKRRYPAKLGKQGIARQPRSEVERRFFQLLDDLDATLGHDRWLAGDALSIADLSVVCQLDELIRTSDLAPRIMAYGNFSDWYRRCNEAAPARTG
jgi:glutathione S-transferase